MSKIFFIERTDIVLSKKIKKLRLECGKTQQELADALNISRSTLAGYESESKQPSYEMLVKIASYFSVSTDYLLGLSENRFPDEELEWRYPHIQNRLGTILSKYCSNNEIADADFAQALGISADLLDKIKLGVYTPTIPLLNKIAAATGYDMDFLTGAQSSTSVVTGSVDIGGQKIETYLIESDCHFRSRFEEFCLLNEVTDENVSDLLGLSHEEYIDITCNRMPTLSELLRISYGFGVSIDFLVGKTDIPSISQAEKKLLNAFENLSEDNQDIIIGKTKELLREQRFDNPPVAADGNRKAVGK